MTGSVALNEWTFPIGAAGERKSFFFRLGTADEMAKGTSEVEFVVCGLEEISANEKDQAHLLFA